MNYKIAAATLVLACAVGTAGCSNNGNGQQGDVPAGATTGQPGAPYAGASAGAARLSPRTPPFPPFRPVAPALPMCVCAGSARFGAGRRVGRIRGGVRWP